MADELVYKINLDTGEMENSLVDLNSEIVDLTISTKDLNKEQKALEKDGKKNSEQWNNNNKKIVENKENMKALKTEYNNHSKVLQNTNKLKKEEGGHLETLKAKLSFVTNKINKLTEAELKDVEVGGKMIAKQKSLSNELKNTEEAGGNFNRSVGDYAKGTEELGGVISMAGGSAGKFGSIIGNLPKIFKSAKVAVGGLFKMLLTNPIGILLTAIAALIRVATAVLSKFQPVIDFVSDKLAFLGGLVDGFVESMKSVGDVIAAVISGDFSKAADLVGEMGDKIAGAGKMAELYNKTLRDVERQQKLNDATTAETAIQLTELENAYKDTSKSAEERSKILSKLSKIKQEQAQDDANQTNILLDNELQKINQLHGTKISNANEASQALEDALINEEEYNSILDQIIETEVNRGKVAEVTANALREQGKLAIKNLSEQQRLIKSQTKYYEESHQTILDGSIKLTGDLLDEEENRLKNIQYKKIEDAKKTLEIARNTYGEDSALRKSAELDYQSELISIKNDTNKQILDNQGKFLKQELDALSIALELYQEENIEALKDTTITTEDELKVRLTLHRSVADDQIKIIEERAKQEKWSADKLKLELLKIEDGYNDKKDELSKNLITNLEKTEKERVTLKKRTEQLIWDNKLALGKVSQDEYDKWKLDAEIEALKKSNEYALMSEQEKLDAIAVLKAEYAEVEKEEKNGWDALSKEEKFNHAMGAANDLNNALSDLNNVQADLELTKVNNKYNAEDKLRKVSFDKAKKDLDSQFKKGLISQKQFDNQMNKLSDNYNKSQGEADVERKIEEDKIKKDTFESNKKFQIANIIMSTAQALIGIQAGYAPTLPVGTPFMIAQMLATGIIGATQVATVSATQYKAEGGGLLEGALHNQGGIQLTPNIEAEGGEFIINRASTQAYAPLINSINQAGNTTGDSNNVADIFDYEKMADAMQSKKVYVNSHDITDQQNEDVKITDRTEF